MQDQLLLQYSYLADGESEAGQLCPACNGGATGETTLSVSRVGERLLWKCHRASCGFSGGSGSKRSGFDGGRTRPTVSRGMVGRTYYRTATELPSDVVEAIRSKYYLSPRHWREMAWCAPEERIALPVKDWDGELLGAALRSENGQQPKVKLHAEDDAVACYRNYGSDKLIIVEDIYSALRCSDYMNAAAILGTHINDVRVLTMREIKPSVTYLALDADAFDRTIKYVKQFRGILRMIPVKLERDLKNLSPEELDVFFREM